MDLKTFKQKLLKDLKFKKAYLHPDVSTQIGDMIHEARIIKGLTQKELAKKIDTKQSAIARIENGSPTSIRFLEKIAKALNTMLIAPKFEFMTEDDKRKDVEEIWQPQKATEVTLFKQNTDSSDIKTLNPGINARDIFAGESQ